MTDDRLGQQLAAWLEAADAPLPPAVQAGLACGRSLAMARVRPQTALATASGPSLQAPTPRMAGLAGGIVLLAILLALYAWQRSSTAAGGADELELLADDVPPSAYLDRGFQQWLSGSLAR